MHICLVQPFWTVHTKQIERNLSDEHESNWETSSIGHNLPGRCLFPKVGNHLVVKFKCYLAECLASASDSVVDVLSTHLSGWQPIGHQLSLDRFVLQVAKERKWWWRLEHVHSERIVELSSRHLQFDSEILDEVEVEMLLKYFYEVLGYGLGVHVFQHNLVPRHPEGENWLFNELVEWGVVHTVQVQCRRALDNHSVNLGVARLEVVPHELHVLVLIWAE